MFLSRAIGLCAVILLTLGLHGQAHAQASDEILAAITQYSAEYGVPERLVHRVVKRESKYNPRASHRGNLGLMQIKLATARTMGYRGAAKGLLDADTNLKFGVKYLAGAYLVAGRNERKAMQYYVSGYYYLAKRKGLLVQTGLKRKR
jgi:soluble lytic murein transglycosylase-like protein